MTDEGERRPSLLLVIVAATELTTHLAPHEEMDHALAASSGAIHIELSGRAMISVESGTDPATLRAVLESFRK